MRVISIDELYEKTKIDRWFLYNLKMLVDIDINKLYKNNKLKILKKEGFSDKQISEATNVGDDIIRKERIKQNILPTYKMVDTCAGEFNAKTPYSYSTYETENEIEPFKEKSIIILGGGPNRIGQGIEFDYGCVHAVGAIRQSGRDAIIINNKKIVLDWILCTALYVMSTIIVMVQKIIHITTTLDSKHGER